MKIRIAVIIALFLILSGLPLAVFSHGDDHDIPDDLLEGYHGVAQKAAEHSNAPETFIPCVRGYAGVFPCHRVNLLSYLPLPSLGLSFANDIWGWTDPESGKDYALVGGIEGTAMVDISDPKRPVVLGLLPSHSMEGDYPFWRDIKVYADHAFIVSEFDNHGLQVFDLTQLRNVDASAAPVVLVETGYYGGFSWAHNMAINEESGFAYVVGSNTCAGGLHMVDIGNPTSPTFAGCFADHGYTHDTQCVIYRGPDADYQGREICFSSNAEFDGTPFLNTLSIVDVTDKSSPLALANVEYPNDGYSHQGWLTVDQSYFLHNDELDEWFFDINTTTRIFDVRDVDNPVLTSTVHHDNTSIGHNAYTEGRHLFASNYTSGLRVFSTTEVAGGALPEVAYFDVYPENDNPSFEGGTWSNHPYFRQKNVVAVSSMERGLFILQPQIGASGN